jgi:hypothetical protein
VSPGALEGGSIQLTQGHRHCVHSLSTLRSSCLEGESGLFEHSHRVDFVLVVSWSGRNFESVGTEVVVVVQTPMIGHETVLAIPSHVPKPRAQVLGYNVRRIASGKFGEFGSIPQKFG